MIKANVDLEEVAEHEDVLEFYPFSRKRHPLLTKEQERELFKRIAKGTEYIEIRTRCGKKSKKVISRTNDAEEARNEVIKHNQRLVASMAKRYIAKGYAVCLSLDDLISFGNERLLTSIVDEFDYTRGVRFSTFATNGVRIGIVNGIRRSFYRDRGMGADSEDGYEAIDFIVDKKAVMPEDSTNLQMDEAEKMLASLSPKERVVFYLKHGHDLTFDEVGEYVGLSRERIRQIDKTALYKLRDLFKLQDLCSIS